MIESVVKAGAGRSRMVQIKENWEIIEKKMENFFSISDISFKKVRYNDNILTERISKLVKKGWELENKLTVTYGTETTSGFFFKNKIPFQKNEIDSSLDFRINIKAISKQFKETFP